MERKYENDEMQIDLIEIFYVLKSKILAILGVGLLFGVLACAYAAFMVKPVYTSTSMVLVMPKEVSLSSSLQLGSQLTSDYSVLIISRPVLSEVVDELGLNIDYKALKNAVSITNPDGTRILQLSVQYGDAKKAKEIADKLAEVSSEYIGEQMEVTPPKIIEKGEIPTSRSNAGMSKMAMMGVFAGMVLCAGVVILQSLLDDTIKTEEDIEKYLGISSLSVIPDRKDYINGTRKKSKRADSGQHGSN